MKPITLLAVVAMTWSGAVAMAQTQSQMPTQPDAQTQPSSAAQPLTPPPPPVTPETPAPIVIERKIDLTSPPGPPADMHAAREEAVNALHWAKTEGCRSDPSPRDCVRRAQEDYRAAMAQLGGRH